MIRVEIQADSRYPVNRRVVREVVVRVLTNEGMKSDVVVSIAIVGDRKMAQLHQHYMQLSGTTDVLSFPYIDEQSNTAKIAKNFIDTSNEGKILGDIVISYPQVVEQARLKNCLVDEELAFLVEHGMQHLLGKHHE